jgi:GT2 family glycosyltransferase
MADLAVIVVSYNSSRWLHGCLRSVYAHTGNITLDTVVVDNGSWDASVEVVEREFPDARVVRSENRGFAHGNNRGFETVDAPFVLFLNPDTEIRTGTFETLLSYLREHPSVGLVGCRHVSRGGDLCHTIRRFPSPLRYLLEALGSERFPIHGSWMGERELDPRAYDRETECDWVAGSFMLARRAAVADAGMMDERYFLYSEEPDLCRGVKAAGWAVRYVPAMTIVHYEGPQSFNPRLTAQRAYSRRQYMYKHEGPIRRNLSAAALALFYARRGLGWKTGDPERDARRRAARAALRTLLASEPPPFGALSGPLHGPRPATPSASIKGGAAVPLQRP